MSCSEDTLLVVLELHDDGLDVLASILPLLDALLSVAVEVLLVLISQGLVLESSRLGLHEVLDSLLVLEVSLSLLETLEFSGSLALFFLLLLFSELELLVTDFPELGEVFVLLDLGILLVPLSLDLQLTASLDGGLHLSLALLLLLVQPVSTVLSLSDLPVQNLLLVVSQGLELTDLTIDHALPGSLFVLESLLFALFLHVFELLALESKCLDLFLFFNFLEALSFFDFHELLVGSGQVRTHFGDLLLALNLALLFSLQVLFSLSFDEFALEHLLFELFDVVELVCLELFTDVFRVGLLQFVLLLELGAHLLVILRHLLLLNFDPVLLDVGFDCLFPVSHLCLRFLLVGHIAHQHLCLQGLHHVLRLGHRFVGFLNLLATQLVLVLLLLSVQPATFDLHTTNSNHSLRLLSSSNKEGIDSSYTQKFAAVDFFLKICIE